MKKSAEINASHTASTISTISTTPRQTHAWNRDVIVQYRNRQEEFKAKKEKQKPMTNNDLSDLDNLQMQNLDGTEPFALPKLKQFKKDYDSQDKVPAIYKTMNCSFLEKALFYAIQYGTQTGNLELLDELLDALPPALTIDVNCIIEIRELFDTNPVKLSPLFVSLLNWNIYIHTWDLSFDSSFSTPWTATEVGYRNQIIQKLIRSGATIDDLDHLGQDQDASTTFLDLFILKALDYEALRETLFFILQEANAFRVDLSLIGGRGYTLLHRVMMTLISRTQTEETINYPVFEDTIRILIQNSKQDYSKTIQDTSVFPPRQRTLLDIYNYTLISNDKDTNKKPHFQTMFKLFNIIFEDMATQCLEHAASLQLENFSHIREKLTNYAKEKFIHDKDFYRLDDDKLDGEAIAVRSTIIGRATRQMDAHCNLGFALRDCADYLPIQVRTDTLCQNNESPWYIVVSYCLSPLQNYYNISLSFFNLGYQAVPHVEFDPKDKTFKPRDTTVSIATTRTSAIRHQPAMLLSAASKNAVGTSISNPMPMKNNDVSATNATGITKPTSAHLH